MFMSLGMTEYQSIQMKSNPIKLLGENVTVKSAIECASKCSNAFVKTSRL